ncbi:MAG: type IV pilus biogenesis protein PilP [Aquabacterium sp.]|nr:type IV pilus biogenesis protein PilP [Aquabacterium sp.]
MRKAASTRTIIIAMMAAVAATTTNAGSYLDEMAKRDAQLALLRKEIELRDARAALAGGGLGLPTVQSLSGFDDNLSATLKYPNGRKLVVRRGDTLPGGVEVKRITRAGVVVRVATVDAGLDFDPGEDDSRSSAQERPPAHLLPPIPQVDVPLPSAAANVAPAAPAAAAAKPIARQQEPGKQPAVIEPSLPPEQGKPKAAPNT